MEYLESTMETLAFDIWFTCQAWHQPQTFIVILMQLRHVERHGRKMQLTMSEIKYA